VHDLGVQYTGTRETSAPAPGVRVELGPLGRSPTSPQSPHPGRWYHPLPHHGFLGTPSGEAVDGDFARHPSPLKNPGHARAGAGMALSLD
jgi:hypothetical protein